MEVFDIACANYVYKASYLIAFIDVVGLYYKLEI